MSDHVPQRFGGKDRARPVEPGSVLPFFLGADPAEIELLARNLLQDLALDIDVRIVEGNGDVGIEAERRFRLGWWTTGDETLPAALHRAKTFIYQHARAVGKWLRLTDTWQSAEREIRSDRWRQHLRRVVRELSPSDQAYVRLACRAAQQAASRAARWRSVFPDASSPFDRLVGLFARGAWPLGCHGGSLWVFLWNPRAAAPPRFGPPLLVLGSQPEDRQLFLSAPFRHREASAHWQRAFEARGWRVIHGPVSEEERPPEVQLGHRIRQASAVLGLLDELDSDFGLPWWMFQELDYACACGQPMALVGRGHRSDPELRGVLRIDSVIEDPTAVIEQQQLREWLQRAAGIARSKLSVALLAAWIAMLCGSLAAAQTGATTSSPSAPASQAGASTATPSDPEKQKLEMDKLRAELNKLKEETQELKVGNDAIGTKTRLATAWGSLIGGLLGAAVTVAIGIIGSLLNRTQKKKLEQERAQARVKHLLEIFRDLGSNQSRIRMGAVAILVQMVKKIRSGKTTDPEDRQDLPTIVSTLIIASKHEDRVEIQKQIADGLAQGLEVLIHEGEEPPSEPSRLKEYDFQGARLEDAWWKRIDARGVDFYKARLARAGLRQAFLSRAVFMMAELRNAVLEEADLEEANLQEANLADARAARAHLRKANLRGANLERADLTGADLRGADLAKARLAGAKLQGAQFNGAVLVGADLSATDLAGVDLSGAVLK